MAKIQRVSTSSVVGEFLNVRSTSNEYVYLYLPCCAAAGRVAMLEGILCFHNSYYQMQIFEPLLHCSCL